MKVVAYSFGALHIPLSVYLLEVSVSKDTSIAASVHNLFVFCYSPMSVGKHKVFPTRLGLFLFFILM